MRYLTVAGLAAATAVAVVLAACASTGPAPSAASMTAGVRTSLPAVVPTPLAARAAKELSPPSAPGVTWRAAGTRVGGRSVTNLTTLDHGAIALLWIDTGHVTFRLVPGTRVPEGSPTTPADSRPQTWLSRLVAAFNGGFLLSDHVGGYYDDGRTVSRLVAGMGSLEITTAGTLQVGRWGRDLTMTRSTLVVRQNLPLLVDGGRAMTSWHDTARTWGLANGGLWTANRSALGQLRDGSLVYAYGHEVRPSAMAQALVLVGVQRGMVLDMNKSWPGGFVYRRAPTGLVGERIQPAEWHAPSVYYRRFTKDFIAVLLR